jgi:hypothetical protein
MNKVLGVSKTLVDAVVSGVRICDLVNLNE